MDGIRANVPKKLSGNDLSVKPFLTQVRRTGSYMEGDKIIKGPVVEAELEVPSFKQEEAMDTLLAGVEPEEIDEGREELLNKEPHLASQHMNEYLDEVWN